MEHQSSIDRKQSDERVEAMHVSLQTDIDELAVLRRSNRLSGEDRDLIDEFLKRGRDCLTAFDDLKSDPQALDAFSTDSNPGHISKRAPSHEWHPQARAIHEWWEEAFGLVQEIGWEKPRIQRTLNTDPIEH